MMHFAAPTGTLGALITALEANVTANMWAHTGTDVRIDQLTVTPLDGSGASIVHTVASASKWKGPETPGQTIPQASVIVKLNTDFRGRSYRGRVFLPWPLEAKCDSGRYDSAQAATQNTAWDTFIAAMGTASHELGVASYKHASFALVTSHDVETYLGTQRRRQPRPS